MSLELYFRSSPCATLMPNYLELLEREKEFRLSEQSALINSLLTGTASRGKLSLSRRAGLAMTGLEVNGRRSGIGGRIITDLNGIKDGKAKKDSKDNSNVDELQRNRCCFKPGDLVKLIASGKLLDCTGTVEKSPRDIDVSISIDSSDDSEEMETINSSKISIVKIVDEVGMFGKMKGNLEALETVDRNDLQNYIKEFIGSIGKGKGKDNKNEMEKEKVTGTLTDHLESLNFNEKLVPSGSSLNLEQEIAIEKSLKMISENEKLFLIHGPPGTGKTSVLVELINRLCGNGKAPRILVCGPSNLSVDNILERIKKTKNDPKIIRIGHPSRVLESCQGNTLDFWCENSDAGLLLKDVQVEIDSILKTQLPRCKSREERRAIFGELKELRRERRTRERKLQIDLIDEAEIVFCTLGTACGKKLRNSKKKFDLAIVDEAGQALLPEILIAPILAGKLILAGDHFQLPPTVMNPEIKATLQVSLFEHLITSGMNQTAMLKEQYRMNELIMKWSNEKFYKNQLRASESVANWKLTEDEDVLIFYDTCGFDLWESTESSNGDGIKGILFEESSKFNEGEAKIALDHYKSLLDLGIPPTSIALISPYSAQVSLLRDTLDHPEINSIDAFQGREKDVVILSLVRSNPDGLVGFLGEMRRINVAMTRAKKQLVIIGDSETLSRDTELKGLVKGEKK